MKKAEIRRTFLENRKRLSADTVEEKSKNLCQRFIKLLSGCSVKSLHIFLPIINHKELNTFLIIEAIQQQFSHIKIVIPKTDFVNLSMESFLYESKKQLKDNKLGIPEPIDGERFPDKDIDMVIAPLLAFDKSGFRVGYGKGFYDRYFKKCKPNVLKVGLSFFEPVEIIEDVDQYDVPLDICVTEKKIYTFSDK